MKEEELTKNELVEKLGALRRRVEELEAGLACPTKSGPEGRKRPPTRTAGQGEGGLEPISTEPNEIVEDYRSVVQSASEAICIIQDGLLKFANQAGTHLTGYLEGELLSMAFAALVHPDDLEELVRIYMMRLRAEHVPPGHRFRIITKAGAVTWVESWSASIIWKGQPAVLSMIRGVNEKVQEEERLRLAHDELDRQVQERTRELQVMNEELLQEVRERQRAELSARESEDRFRRLLEHSPLGIAVAGTHGKIEYVNNKFTELFGYTLKDIPTLEDWWRLAYPDSQHGERVKSEWLQATKESGEKGAEAEPVERKVRCKDGRICVIDFRKTVVDTWVIHTFHDVTEKKLQEQALLESEQMFRLLSEQSLMSIAILQDGVYQYANQAMSDLCEYSLEEILTWRPEEFLAVVHPADRTLVMEQARMKQAGDARQQTKYAFRILTKSSVPKWVEIYSKTIQFKGRPANLLTMLDITDRKQSEDALRMSEQKYRTILETIADGYHEVDLAGNLTLVNDSMCEILGYSREELLGMNYRQLMNEQNAKQIFEAYHAVFKSRVSNPEFAYQVFRKDGRVRDVSVSIALIRDNVGRATGFRGIFRDITERRHLEEQLRQAMKMEAIGRLAGGIAHDFNNLLTVITGYATMISLESSQDIGLARKMDQIHRAAGRAADLTRQLLAFSRKQLLSVRSININDLVREVESMLRRLIGEDIELKVELGKDIGNVRADLSQLEQVVMNLAVNARDAMPRGGTLTIETLDAVLDEGYCASRTDVEPGMYVLICIGDTGHGMTAETVDRVFEPFFTTKGKGTGTGLGLSTVYGIVKQHGGHVAVYSELGSGTTFKIYLPRVDEPVDSQPVGKETQEKPCGMETILLVEDEEAVRDLAAEALEMLGYLVLKAASPKKAVQISENHSGPIDLLLSDVILPETDGKTLYKILAKSRTHMKVLFMSGYTENFIVHRGMLDPEVSFLQKPFTVYDIARKVRSVLDQE